MPRFWLTRSKSLQYISSSLTLPQNVHQLKHIQLHGQPFFELKKWETNQKMKVKPPVRSKILDKTYLRTTIRKHFEQLYRRKLTSSLSRLSRGRFRRLAGRPSFSSAGSDFVRLWVLYFSWSASRSPSNRTTHVQMWLCRSNRWKTRTCLPEDQAQVHQTLEWQHDH